MKKGMKQSRGRSRRRKKKQRRRKKNTSNREDSSREREREKWGYGCQALEVLRALMETSFRLEDGGIMFLRNICCIYAQTTGLPDGMSTYGRVWSVGVQAVRGAAGG